MVLDFRIIWEIDMNEIILALKHLNLIIITSLFTVYIIPLYINENVCYQIRCKSDNIC